MADPCCAISGSRSATTSSPLQFRDAGAGEDATWCAFAVWASKTAGATIRGEVLPARAKQLLIDNAADQSWTASTTDSRDWPCAHLTHDHLGQVVEDITADVSTQIAAGNVLVFAELAPLFTALLDASARNPPAPKSSQPQLAPALATLDSAEDAATLDAAFSAYGQALFGPTDRAALILQANTLAVAHEQRRLQPAISAALNAAISDTLQKVIERDVVGHLPTAEVRHLLDGLTDDVCKVLDGAWDTALTESIMRLVTASETLDLRRDVPPLSDGLFPPGLSRPERDGRRAGRCPMGQDRRNRAAIRCPRLGRPGAADELHREPVPFTPDAIPRCSTRRSRRPSWPSWREGQLPPGPL